MYYHLYFRKIQSTPEKSILYYTATGLTRPKKTVWQLKARCYRSKMNDITKFFSIFSAPEWFTFGCLNHVEAQCWQKVWRRGRMLHLLLHLTWFKLPDAQSGLPHLQEKVPLGLSIQMVFNQSKFNLSTVQKLILINKRIAPNQIKCLHFKEIDRYMLMGHNEISPSKITLQSAHWQSKY